MGLSVFVEAGYHTLDLKKRVGIVPWAWKLNTWDFPAASSLSNFYNTSLFPLIDQYLVFIANYSDVF